MSLFARKKAAPARAAARTPARTPAPAASPAEPPPPPADYYVGDPLALRLRDALAVGAWQDAQDFLESVRTWRQRSHYVTVLANIKGRPDWIDQWVAARPDSSIPVLFSGVHRKNWAWEARGGGRASTVKEDSWPVFQTRLVQADRELARAAALDPGDPTPIASSLWVAMGLSLGQAEIRRRFAAADQREHVNNAACVAMIQATARKWGGSHDAMFEFARWAGRESPEGTPGHKLIALAHIERWLDAPTEERVKYFLEPRVQAEVRAAADRSVRSPLYPSDATAWQERNVFAFCFSLMHDYSAALGQMDLIGSRITPSPWQYQNGKQPGKAYLAARQRALQAVSSPRVP